MKNFKLNSKFYLFIVFFAVVGAVAIHTPEVTLIRMVTPGAILCHDNMERRRMFLVL